MQKFINQKQKRIQELITIKPKNSKLNNQIIDSQQIRGSSYIFAQENFESSFKEQQSYMFFDQNSYNLSSQQQPNTFLTFQHNETQYKDKKLHSNFESNRINQQNHFQQNKLKNCIKKSKNEVNSKKNLSDKIIRDFFPNF